MCKFAIRSLMVLPIICLAAQIGAQSNTTEPPLLQLNQSIERPLEREQTHAYRFALTAGQVTQIVVEHHGQDIVVTVFDPAGKLLSEFDQEFRKEGREIVTQVAETAGVHRLEIKPKLKNALPGRYTIAQTELRAANEKDRALQEARDQRASGEKALREGRYSDALQPLERALQLYQEIYGAEHIEVARVYKWLGQYYWMKSGLIEKSLESHQRAVALREKLLGSEHPETAESLTYLSIPWHEKIDYQQAEQLLLRAIGSLEKAMGPEHPFVAYSFGRLARNYNAKGDAVNAERAAVRALNIYEQALGSERREVATMIELLGFINQGKGDYDKTEYYFQRATETFEKTLSPIHPMVGNVLNNLCTVHYYKGEYEKARQTCQRALEIFEKGQGAGFIHVGTSLASLGNIHRLTGEYAKAAETYQRVVKIMEATTDPRGRLMASHLLNFAAVYLEQRAFADALPLYQKAREIYERVLEPAHAEQAIPLTGLGAIYRQQGDFPQAERLLRRALEIREQAFGAQQADVASSLNELALLKQQQGEYSEAEALARRAVQVIEQILGRQHPDTAKYLRALASPAEARGDWGQAVETQARINAISEHHIGVNLVFGSERQKRAYLEMMADEVDRTVSLHLRSAPQQAGARDLALTLILQRKGRLLETATDELALLRRNLTAEEQTLLDRLQTARSQLAWLVLNEPPKDKLDRYRAQVREREERIEALEADISRRSAKYRAQTQPVTLAVVQAAIPADAALVEFVVWRPFNVRATSTAQTWGAPRYAAYALRQQGGAQFVDLGEVAQIERAIAAWRQALRNPARAQVKTLARAVDRTVMQPVRALLGEAKQILISPDGALNLIPFAALVDEQNRYLIERYSFSYLTSGRDLLRLGLPRASGGPPLIVANPDFGKVATITPKPGSAARVDLEQVHFQPLSGTAGEARALQQLLPQAVVLSRQHATETALKQAAAPSILHVATHGFFLEDTAAEPARQANRANKTTTNRAAALRLSRLAVNVQNPLLRSGLALADANQGRSDKDDGLLTALEAAGLNLWGTKLVVLSACDTGVGEVRNGDGVYGLRRALAQAGAETQVMSLWPVGDADTRDLMVGYYKGLQSGQGRGEALRQVQLQMLRGRQHRHPHYWASFIQSGEWANLAGKR